MMYFCVAGIRTCKADLESMANKDTELSESKLLKIPTKEITSGELRPLFITSQSQKCTQSHYLQYLTTITTLSQN